MRANTLFVVFMLAALALSSAAAYFIWQELASVNISFHGYIALGLGVFFTLIAGVGLMSLSFYSSRSGHDEQIYGEKDHQEHSMKSRSE